MSGSEKQKSSPPPLSSPPPVEKDTDEGALKPAPGKPPAKKMGRSRRKTTGKTFAKPTGEFKPPRIILNAVEGFGKTTFASYAPNPALIMSSGETGYLTLVGVDLVPSIDCVESESWQETLDLVDQVAVNDDYETIVLDALGGFERQAHDMILKRDFSGNTKKFNHYHKGQELAVNDWLKLLKRLEQSNKTVVILSHSIIKTFSDPLGADFDRYRVDCHKYTWSVTHKWCDAVLFGVFRSIVDESASNKKGKGKGIGGQDRVIYTEHHDAYDAKNRFSMPAEIELTDEPSEMFSAVWKHIKR